MPSPDPLTAFVEQITRNTLDSGGCTADVAARRILPGEDAWYFPRFPEHTMIVSLPELGSSLVRFIELHHHHHLAGDIWLGTWINPAIHQCYLDLITRHEDEHEALRLARLYSHAGGRKIIAICNPARRQTRQVWTD
ncbi:hypothetical protein [Microlunatus parietis]|uniref:Uncharacterized protein n=1 Tax=Microlunatus parietis TaxID=682979 RepID=A0A7Y9LG00_9ACTN|nr:hypothetical protein [Microlunatus parietis]NYE74626.1 hypothetical protein [Microlunatus parietis]